MAATSLQTITFIYGLFDPRTNALRYIGKAINTLSRHWSHCCMPHPSLQAWVASLADDGFEPEMRILQECGGDGAAEELQWIKACLAKGDELLNRRGVEVANPDWPKLGRPEKKPKDRYKTPQRQLGRVPDEPWEVLRSVTEVTGVPFIQWALPVLLKEANRLLRAAKRQKN